MRHQLGVARHALQRTKSCLSECYLSEQNKSVEVKILASNFDIRGHKAGPGELIQFNCVVILTVRPTLFPASQDYNEQTIVSI